MLNPAGTADPKQQVIPAKTNVVVHPPGVCEKFYKQPFVYFLNAVMKQKNITYL